MKKTNYFTCIYEGPIWRGLNGRDSSYIYSNKSKVTARYDRQSIFLMKMNEHRQWEDPQVEGAMRPRSLRERAFVRTEIAARLQSRNKDINNI